MSDSSVTVNNYGERTVNSLYRHRIAFFSPCRYAFSMQPEHDTAFMRLALQQAARGLGNTWPNPAVGCVVVQNDRLLAMGHTQPGGRPHAEVVALAALPPRLPPGSITAYVTLEPCAHHGQTPPCANALIEAGVKRVFVASRDPDPRVNGQGIARLQAAGVEVIEGVGEREAQYLNAGFFSRIQRQRPMIAAKIATSLDGRIALANGHSQWITSHAARQYGHWLRATHDAIFVGSRTVRADNPRLTCRLPGLEHRSPLRVVLDTKGTLPPTSAVFEPNSSPTWWCVSDAIIPPMPPKEGVRILPIPTSAGVLNISAILASLAEAGITRLLVESGAAILTSMLRQHLIDRLYWFSAPHLFGGDALPALTALQNRTLQDTPWNVVEERLFDKGERLLCLQKILADIP
jgi:diaminohydroxyphosphoribosylaminopyrimidine deaminase / 5-amino-6-(5-phosphoribosylamino)uracil reductase